MWASKDLRLAADEPNDLMASFVPGEFCQLTAKDDTECCHFTLTQMWCTTQVTPW